MGSEELLHGTSSHSIQLREIVEWYKAEPEGVEYDGYFQGGSTNEGVKMSGGYKYKCPREIITESASRLGARLDSVIKNTQRWQVDITDGVIFIRDLVGYPDHLNKSIYRAGKSVIDSVNALDAINLHLIDCTHPRYLAEFIKELGDSFSEEFFKNNLEVLDIYFTYSKVMKAFVEERSKVEEEGSFLEEDFEDHKKMFLEGYSNPIGLYWYGLMLDNFIAKPRGMQFDFKYFYICFCKAQEPSVFGVFIQNESEEEHETFDFTRLLLSEGLEGVENSIKSMSGANKCPFLMAAFDKNPVMLELFELVEELMNHLFSAGILDIQAWLSDEERIKKEFDIEHIDQLWAREPNLAFFVGKIYNPNTGEIINFEDISLEGNPFFKPIEE